MGECSIQSVPKMVLENSFGSRDESGRFVLTMSEAELMSPLPTDCDKVLGILNFMSTLFTVMVSHVDATSVQSSTAN